jgi:hypothetical protein
LNLHVKAGAHFSLIGEGVCVRVAGANYALWEMTAVLSLERKLSAVGLQIAALPVSPASRLPFRTR